MDLAFGILWGCLAMVLGVATLPGTVELLFLTLAGALPPRRSPSASSSAALQVAVVVPAHDEEGGIAHCIESLRACDAAGNRVSLVVVADNCSDATAERALSAGARVIERYDTQNLGKGYALDHAFQILLGEGIDAILVVDADSVVAPNFVSESVRFLRAGADGVQCAYGVTNADTSLRTRLQSVGVLCFNVLRLRGRDRLGFSVGILGNGFGLSRATLEAIPWDATSLVEDLEYHLRLVRAGRSVCFVPKTWVRAPLPTGGTGAATQRARWEGGRLRTVREQVPGLTREVLHGRMRLLEPLLELLLLPLAYHVVLLCAALSVPVPLGQGLAAFGLATVALHLLVSIRVTGGGLRALMALAMAPFYVLWKLALAPMIARASRPDAGWVRTERESPQEEKP